MKSITLTEAFLRALGEGVRALYEGGHPTDQTRADEVVSTMKQVGFVLLGRRFVPALYFVVRSHFHPDGEDFDKLTPEERNEALAQAGVDRWDLRSPHLIEQLAYAILNLKLTRGRPRNPLKIQ